MAAASHLLLLSLVGVAMSLQHANFLDEDPWVAWASEPSGDETAFTYYYGCAPSTEVLSYGVILEDGSETYFSGAFSCPETKEEHLSGPGGEECVGFVFMNWKGHPNGTSRSKSTSGGVPCPTTTTTTTTTPTTSTTSSTTSSTSSSTTPCNGDACGGNDPRMQNIKGEHFNVWKTGNITLLRLPSDKTKKAQLLVETTVTKYPNDTRSCAGYLMSSFALGGSWFDGWLRAELDAESSSLRVSVNHTQMVSGEQASMGAALLNVQDSKTLKIRFQDALLIARVIDYADGPYLKFVAQNIRSLPGGELGGILGYDDHSHWLKPECDVATGFTNMRSIPSRASASLMAEVW